MTKPTLVKLILAGIGVLVWAYGARFDEPTYRWIGIGFFVAALLVRFWQRDGERPESDAE
ncbi:MAG TPA: hypothetical protein VMM18_11865 [Gemmatimonadaceae bacterium]|nr:hypothetical protein [Gemmatimonadaceae bacterium]